MKRILLLIICAFSPIAHGQKFEQLALTPPIGWKGCHQFLCDVNLSAELPGHDVLMLRPGKKCNDKILFDNPAQRLIRATIEFYFA